MIQEILKRLRGDERARFRAEGWNLGTVEEACAELERLSTECRILTVEKINLEREREDLRRVVGKKIAEIVAAGEPLPNYITIEFL